MAGDDPLTFPDVPRAELDQALTTLVEQAGKVLETQGRLRALVRANRAVVSHLELEAVLRTIIASAVELVGARYGALGVISDGGGLEQFIHVGMDEGAVEEIGHLPEGHGLLGALIDDPRPIRIDAIAADPRSSGFPPGHPPMSAFLGVPITVRDTVYGNLYLTDPERGGFTEDDEQLVRALAATAGFAIDNARLFAETAARQAWSAATADITAAVLGGSVDEGVADLISRLVALTGARAVRIVDVEADAWPDDAVLRSAVEGRQPARTDDLGALPPDGGDRLGPALLVPFDRDEAGRSLLVVAREPGARVFTAFELERTVALARQTQLAVELAAARADRQRMLLLEDRARIARDLHDHAIQQLFGAGLELQSIQAAIGGPLAQRIDSTVRTLDDTIAQIRTIIFALAQPHGDDSSLRHRLIDIVHEIGGTLPVPATVSFSGPVETVVEPRLADDIVAFVREALANTVRHSGGSTAAVFVTASADEVVAVVSDDGHGIGTTPRRSGLANLAERARGRDGSLVVDSDSAGTRLTFCLPLSGGDGS
ncbi:GAF domain-containing protein [Leifsonia sp. WHRI 6310E]|uniref:GAF domain-containing sensor histidine kinase n=1 Tax=Leifsonia sp. WHRI 6310E TaxID=3162562 RepID=UPI0032F00B4E